MKLLPVALTLFAHFSSDLSRILILSLSGVEMHLMPVRYQHKLHDSILLVLMDKGSTVFVVIVTSGIDLLQHFDAFFSRIHIVSLLHLKKHAMPVRYQNMLWDSIPWVLIDKGSTVFGQILASGIDLVAGLYSDLSRIHNFVTFRSENACDAIEISKQGSWFHPLGTHAKKEQQCLLWLLPVALI